ncbi:hypothetical protein TH53_11745 [Pedobacter lusitanus]|uniref:Uncharacterized protein n=1 Tax=Pedobacter lusitanus TaxID=1503925 RepID=A0A0D0F5X7_9SPHI|nr:hypothetical protein [Pedobacter lusitanus]KIO77033.1 hypothetical protein TH53_11745 [Pedobacter lusitanus]
MEELQTLEFYWLKYEVSAIEELIQNSDGIDSFVFSYYFPKSANSVKLLQLVAYAHMVNKAHPKGVFSKTYDILSVYENQAETISGPVILSNNILSLQQMEALINKPEKPDYLIFIPHLDKDKHIYYRIRGYHTPAELEFAAQRMAVFADPPPEQTNPSPPAT